MINTFHVIAQKGFEGLRLREVAARAGIDHSTLHHHFPTKADLVAAVLDYASEQFRRRRGPDDGSPTTIQEHLGFLAEMIVESPELHTVLREFDLHGRRDKRVRAMIVRSEKGWRDRLAVRMQKARAEGEFAIEFDPVIGAELVIAVVKGASFNPTATPGTMRLFERMLHQKGTNRRRGKRQS